MFNVSQYVSEFCHVCMVGEPSRKRQKQNTDDDDVDGTLRELKENFLLAIVPQVWVKKNHRKRGDSESNFLFAIPKEDCFVYFRSLLKQDRFVEEIRAAALDVKLTDAEFGEEYGQLTKPPHFSFEYNSGIITEWGQTWPREKDDDCYFSVMVENDSSKYEKEPSSSLVRVIEPKPGMLRLFHFKLKPGTRDFSWEIQKPIP